MVTAENLTFELERFAWGAPDRLHVAGRFAGLRAAPADDPVLVVRGHDRTHRLPAVPDSVAGPPEDGQPWWAEFAWEEPPVAVEAAELQFGADVTVPLPEPDTQDSGAEPRALAVRSAEAPIGAGAADRVRAEAQLLAAEEEIRELRAAHERLQAELGRAQEDLRAERERHADDAERFRDGLARVQTSAREAIEARDAALDRARAGAEELLATIRAVLRDERG
jgi:hypothetical protein